MKNVLVSLATCLACTLTPARPSKAQSELQVTFGTKGVSQISYAGVTLEDTGAYPSDTFHIWHMKSSDLSGNVLESGQYGWGEGNNGTTWDATNKIETYNFSWGSIATRFVQQGDRLDMVVTEQNNANSGIVFDGAEIYPFALHFPQMPKNFFGYTQYAITTTAPGVSVADYGMGVVTSAIPNESMPLYGGWKSAGGNVYTPLMSGTTPDGIATFLPHNDLPLKPGASLTYTVSLRFTPEGTAADVTDAYASFASTYPSQMTWTDKRILGTAYLASSPSNADITQPSGFPTNPRRFFNDPTVDITTNAGMRLFQARMLAQAVTNVSTARALNSQGVITWDLEGEQYPQSTSYVCSPDQVATVAPEMEATVLDTTSAFSGMRLDDAYFKTMTNAGLRVGVCLRPQVFAINGNGTAQQSFLTGNEAIIANLENKARFANARWGVTIFYVDSTVDATGGTLDPAIFQQLITDMPSYLFIPEESTTRYFAYTAPFFSFLFHTDLGTPAEVLKVYPKAFGANLVNDVSAATLATYMPQLTAQVRQGDILMGHADYWQANDPTLVAIYTAAGQSGTPAPPVQATPVVSWATPAAVGYGTALSGAQLNASANVAGTFAYSPAAGTVLGAGVQTLTATFTPQDTVDYKSVSATTTLQVNQAAPVLNWAAPAAFTTGAALGSAQLDATASIAGTFAYTPAAGTVLSAGTYTLRTVFTPADATDYLTENGTVQLAVNPAPAPPVAPPVTPAPPVAPAPPPPVAPAPVPPVPSPVPVSPPANVRLAILAPASGTVVSGRIAVTGYVTLTLDSAATYLMVDGQEAPGPRVGGAPWLYPLDTTTLTNGSHVLQLWGHDIGNNVTLSSTISVLVAN